MDASISDSITANQADEERGKERQGGRRDIDIDRDGDGDGDRDRDRDRDEHRARERGRETGRGRERAKEIPRNHSVPSDGEVIAHEILLFQRL